MTVKSYLLWACGKHPRLPRCFILKQISDCRHMIFSPFAFFHIRSSEPHCDCRLYTFPRVGLITKSFPQIVSSTHTLVPLLPSTNGSSLFLYNDVFQLAHSAKLSITSCQFVFLSLSVGWPFTCGHNEVDLPAFGLISLKYTAIFLDTNCRSLSISISREIL